MACMKKGWLKMFIVAPWRVCDLPTLEWAHLRVQWTSIVKVYTYCACYMIWGPFVPQKISSSMWQISSYFVSAFFGTAEMIAQGRANSWIPLLSGIPISHVAEQSCGSGLWLGQVIGLSLLQIPVQMSKLPQLNSSISYVATVNLNALEYNLF